MVSTFFCLMSIQLLIVVRCYYRFSYSFILCKIRLTTEKVVFEIAIFTHKNWKTDNCVNLFIPALIVQCTLKTVSVLFYSIQLRFSDVIVQQAVQYGLFRHTAVSSLHFQCYFIHCILALLLLLLPLLLSLLHVINIEPALMIIFKF